MSKESVNLIETKNELLFFIFLILSIFLINIFYEYSKYKDIKEDEVFLSKATILNIYKKHNYDIYKLKTINNEIVFTKLNKQIDLKKNSFVEILFITKYISFYEYLKGFFTKTLFISKIDKKEFDLRSYLSEKINSMHEDKIVAELFNALFLALPISTQLREFCTNFAISHLIAISGFHLGIFSFIIYIFSFLVYFYIHKIYFNHRNRRFDILIISCIILLFYLILIDFVASFLRAFIMFIFAIIFLRSNIKILSFNTLLITLLFIIAFFPKYLFSLSLWFSVLGVFYIFLFLQYFKNLPKFYMLILFNFWIFFALNPIIHYFFYETSTLQLFSAFITLFFTVFYPLELFLHFIGFADLLDSLIKQFLTIQFSSYTVQTSLWFFIIYLVFSLLAVFKKEAFYIVNILLIVFNVYAYI